MLASRPCRSALLLAALPAAIGTAGCYAYYPARDHAALVGKRASLSLTDSGSVVLASRIGAGIIGIEGDFLGDSSNTYLLAVRVTKSRSGSESDWKGEHVAVPHVLVASAEERAFSASRTILGGAIAVAAVVAITLALRGRGEGGQGAVIPGPKTGQ